MFDKLLSRILGANMASAIAGPLGSAFKDAVSGKFSGFSNSGLGSMASSLFGLRLFGGKGAASNWLKGQTGSGLTDAQIQQNQWNASQAEAAFGRELEADSTKFQRQTADMQSAGLNPAMMYGDSVSGAGNVGGMQATGVDPGSSSAGLLDSLLNISFAKQRMSNLRAEGDVLRSQAEKNSADAELSRSTSSLNVSRTKLTDLEVEYYPSLTQSTIDKINVEFDNLMKDLDVKEHQILEIDSEAALNEAKSSVERITADWLPRLNAAKEKHDLASAAQAFAEAAFQSFSLSFAKEHGGQTPGYNMWSGLAASVSAALKDVGMEDVDLDKLDWVDLAWPWFSFFRKRNR